MSNSKPRVPLLQRKTITWTLLTLTILSFGLWVSGKLLKWPWPDGADWQAMWSFFMFLVALIAAIIALDQLTAHNKAQIEQDRPYVSVDFSFRSQFMLIEVKNIGKTPAKDISLAWDIEPKSLDAHDQQALKRNLINGTIPFLAPGRSIRYPLGPAPVYFGDKTLPRRFKVSASYGDTHEREFGSGEQMVLDLDQGADALIEVDSGTKNWNAFDRQSKAQQKIARDLAAMDQHMKELQRTLVVLGSQIVTSLNQNDRSNGVEWVIFPEGKDGYQVINVGDTTAESVIIKAATTDTDQSELYIQDHHHLINVAVNDAIPISFLRTLDNPRVPKIRISWNEGGETFESIRSIS